MNALPIGKTLEYRCNAKAIIHVTVVTRPNSWGLQDALSTDGSLYKQVDPKTVFPFDAKKGIGFYRAHPATSDATPELVDMYRKHRAAYGRGKTKPVILIDKHGDRLEVTDITESLALFDRYRSMIDATGEAHHQVFTATRNAYWQDLYDKLQTIANSLTHA